jgi:hypothetical protein
MTRKKPALARGACGARRADTFLADLRVVEDAENIAGTKPRSSGSKMSESICPMVTFGQARMI